MVIDQKDSALQRRKGTCKSLNQKTNIALSEGGLFRVAIYKHWLHSEAVGTIAGRLKIEQAIARTAADWTVCGTNGHRHLKNSSRRIAMLRSVGNCRVEK
jgi:hypothetical protein